jgi:hypothetical protein
VIALCKFDKLLNIFLRYRLSEHLVIAPYISQIYFSCIILVFMVELATILLVIALTAKLFYNRNVLIVGEYNLSQGLLSVTQNRSISI